MPKRGVKFFKHETQLPLANHSVFRELCCECFEDANPAWSDVDGRWYCRACVPDHLRHPGKQAKEANHDYEL